MDIVSKPNVLLVDDNPIDLELLGKKLRNLDISIIKANSGSQALSKIKGIDLALALVDIQMPHMNGLELAKLIREEKNRQTVPIIFLTAYYDGDFQFAEGYKAGAVDYMLKPFNSSILLSKVNVFLDLEKQRNLLVESKHKLEESKERLQAIYENIPGGVMIIGSDYIIHDVNEATCKLTGYRKEELVGHRCDKLCEGGSISGKCPVWTSEETEIREVDTFIKCFDGQHIPILKNSKQIHLDGKAYILEIFQDISDRKLAESAVQESEKKYRTLVEQSLQGIVVISHSRIVFANDSFAHMTGYTIEELNDLKEEQVASVINFEAPYLFYPEHTDYPSLKEEKAGGYSGEYKGSKKDGSLCWFQFSANPILYGGKKAIQVTVIDITERKLAEEALVESENMYRTLLDASPEGILIINLSGRITEVSSITPEIFGTANKHDLIGKHFMRFIHQDSRKKVRKVIEKTMSEGLEQDIEFILTKSGKEEFVGEISTTLIQENNGMPQSFMAIIRDISQRKRMEEQLIHTERMAGLGEMATGIAHEINQPLNTISISLENMLHKISTNDRSENYYLIDKINKIFGSIYRIGKIIDHIRAFSRDHGNYIPTAFDINESIRNALSLITSQYKHKAIDLITDLNNNLPWVIGNTFKFEQVILNLIINAKDALEDQKLNKKPDKEIKIRTFQDERNIFVEVSDNGIGIKKEDIGNIMLPFYSTKEEGKGTGMGLAISFGIIKEMKGNIDIRSELLKGTIIQITLPMVKV